MPAPPFQAPGPSTNTRPYPLRASLERQSRRRRRGMDWTLAVERNRTALQCIVASLRAMAALSRTAPTMPRYLHRAVARLLRPAESAVRRLIIIAARGIEVPPVHPPKAQSSPFDPRTLVGAGPIPRHDSAASRAMIAPPGEPSSKPPTALSSPSDNPLRGPASAARAADAEPRRLVPAAPTRLKLPLVDPLRLPRRWRGIQRSTPRILFPGDPGFVPFPVRTRPPPDDPVNAARIAMRLDALTRALEDLRGHALRFAHWQAARQAAATALKALPVKAPNAFRDRSTIRPARLAPRSGKNPPRLRSRRLTPLKPGRPPGWRRRCRHEVHALLDELHALALQALGPPDRNWR